MDVNSTDNYFVGLVAETKFSDRFKLYLKEFYLNTEQNKQVKKRFVLERRWKGFLKDLFTNVSDGSYLIILSESKEVYMFGTLTALRRIFMFEGSIQNSYGFKGYIYIIDPNNKAKTVTHYVHIDETADKLILRSIIDENLNACVHEFEA